jgi:hypothetical protein
LAIYKSRLLSLVNVLYVWDERSRDYPQVRTLIQAESLGKRYEILEIVQLGIIVRCQIPFEMIRVYAHESAECLNKLLSMSWALAQDPKRLPAFREGHPVEENTWVSANDFIDKNMVTEYNARVAARSKRGTGRILSLNSAKQNF